MRRVVRFVRSARRRWVLASLQVRARLAGAVVDVRVAPDVQFGPQVRISVDRGSRNRLELGPGVQLHQGVLLLLRGGSVRLGERVSVRRGTVLNVSGELDLAGDNILSYYNVVHCAERIRFGRFSSTNEFCTIVDSTHFHDGASEFFYENVKTSPIEVGRNVWIASKSTVLMGVTIGDDAIVAAHAVVHGDVERGTVVGGIPARVLRSS
jgi:acetyltransferase-like isoleucine patch superfamily enzyme